MAEIALVTDSTAYLPPEAVKQYHVHVIPLYVHMGGKTYRDGFDLDLESFYQYLETATELPTTSQPSMGDFLELYRELSKKADAIISVHISAGISGTIASALAARQALQAEMENPPEVYVIDSRITSASQALIVMAAGRAIAEGRPAAEIAAMAKGMAERSHAIFVVDTLKYLHKGGRIGGAAALMGTALKIKPLLYFREGKIDALEKVRTSKRAKARMLEVVEEWAGGKPIRFGVAHARAQEEAHEIRDYILTHLECQEHLISHLSPVIATHVGPGTIGIVFYTVEEGDV